MTAATLTVPDSKTISRLDIMTLQETKAALVCRASRTPGKRSMTPVAKGTWIARSFCDQYGTLSELHDAIGPASDHPLI